MSRTAKLSALIILLLAVSNAADARGPGRGGPPGPPPMDRVLERHADRLGLDADTRDEIRRIAAESRDASEPIHDRLRALHDEMRELLGAQTPDEARVMEQAERIGEAEVALQKHRLRATLRIRALLTPEQRAELVEIHGERKRQGRSPRDHRGRPSREEPPDRR